MSTNAFHFEAEGGTIPTGNWRSMNNEMAGKIMSAVRGVDEKYAAVAKELNATRTRVSRQRKRPSRTSS